MDALIAIATHRYRHMTHMSAAVYTRIHTYIHTYIATYIHTYIDTYQIYSFRNVDTFQSCLARGILECRCLWRSIKATSRGQAVVWSRDLCGLDNWTTCSEVDQEIKPLKENDQ